MTPESITKPVQTAIRIDIEKSGEEVNTADGFSAVSLRSPDTPVEMDIMFYPEPDTNEYAFRWPTSLSEEEIIDLITKLATKQSGNTVIMSRSNNDQSRVIFFGDNSEFLELEEEQTSITGTFDEELRYGGRHPSQNLDLVDDFDLLRFETEDFALVWSKDGLVCADGVTGLGIIAALDLPPSTIWLNDLFKNTITFDHSDTAEFVLAVFTEALEQQTLAA